MRFDATRIERELAVLVGLPLCNTHRAADLLVLHFGALKHGVAKYGKRKGEQTTYGEYALHVQCTWRITGPDGLVVASRDLYEPHSELLRQKEFWQWHEDPDWDCMTPNANRWDERIKPWIAGGPYVVESVAADAFGGLHVAIASGFALDVFPDWSHDAEYWRFFMPDDPRPHFVVEGGGINALP